MEIGSIYYGMKDTVIPASSNFLSESNLALLGVITIPLAFYIGYRVEKALKNFRLDEKGNLEIIADDSMSK